MKVFIYVDEQRYGGLHGYFNQGVCAVHDMEEAYEIGYEWGWELCNSYEDLYPYDDYDCEEDRIEDIEQNIEVLIYAIRADVEGTVWELDELASDLGYEDFVEKYCEKDVLT